MAFHESCQNIFIENRDDVTVLFAEVDNGYGSWEQTSLVLDEILGFEEGNLVWEGSGAFTDIVETIDLYFDDYNLPYLRVSIFDEFGDRVQQELNLADRIAQQDGCLVLV
jgi:hypothetical protein